MNKELEDKLEEIIGFIKETTSYKNFLKSKVLLENRSDIKEKIQNIKTYQQELVKNPSKRQELDLKIQACLDFLNNDPTYLEYTTYLNEVNNMLTIFENKINHYFENLFK